MSEHQFRKKPVVIEAVQWPGDKFKAPPPDWFRNAMYAEPGSVGFVMRIDNDIIIHTLEGQMRAQPGDWIIRGIKGEIYPCKPDIFDATYERATQPASAPADDDDYDGPDLTAIDIPPGDRLGNPYEQVCAAWHREPCGDTLAAIGSAILALRPIYDTPLDDCLLVLQKANEFLTVPAEEAVWAGDIEGIERFAQFWKARGAAVGAPQGQAEPVAGEILVEDERWIDSRAFDPRGLADGWHKLYTRAAAPTQPTQPVREDA